jgi:translation initiation factor IF-1
MVKNTKGGCNGKKVAHKHAVKSTKSGLRISQNKSEIYGVVKRLNGNTFDVTCIDDKVRRCFIRGKFKGRGKRDNIIEVDKWVLIGVREFQQVPSESAVNSKGKKEMEMCDLLEVYSSGERDTLKRTHGIFMKESELSTADAEDAYEFVDADTLRYQNIVSSSSSSSSTVETIRMRKGVKLAPNNVVNPQAMYGDVDDISDDDEDDECISEEEEEEERISEEEEESDSDQEETHYVEKSKSSATATAYNVEINVDDI